MKSNGYITEFQSFYTDGKKLPVTSKSDKSKSRESQEIESLKKSGSHKELITASDKIIVPPNEILTPPELIYTDSRSSTIDIVDIGSTDDNDS